MCLSFVGSRSVVVLLSQGDDLADLLIILTGGNLVRIPYDRDKCMKDRNVDFFILFLKKVSQSVSIIRAIIIRVIFF
jgi:hypothetical protein